MQVAYQSSAVRAEKTLRRKDLKHYVLGDRVTLKKSTVVDFRPDSHYLICQQGFHGNSLIYFHFQIFNFSFRWVLPLPLLPSDFLFEQSFFEICGRSSIAIKGVGHVNQKFEEPFHLLFVADHQV